MALAISDSVGSPSKTKKEPAKNLPADVRTIQQLLITIAAEPQVTVSGKCDEKTIQAIKNFQALFPGATPDGRIDPGPGGKTLNRLNALASPMRLKPVNLTSVKGGGFQVRIEGDAPPAPYQMFLALASHPQYKMYVEPLRNNDLIDKRNLPTLLHLIDTANAWGSLARLKIFVSRGGYYIPNGDLGQPINCPVKPYVGILDPAAIGSDSDLKYTGNGTGRILHMPSIDSKYYFVYAGKFVTDHALRGFDCTTYAGAVYGVDADTGAMAGYGTKLADHVGATKCDMEQKKEKEIKEYFVKNSAGTYFMWNEGHIVMVHDAVVHEFTNRAGGGYKSCNLADYPFATSGAKANYWIRKVNAAFGSFEPGVTVVTASP